MSEHDKLAEARVRNPNPRLDEVDIWSRMLVTEGCWHWLGYVDERRCSGYGRVVWGGRLRAAHRVVYELMRGPIPEGMTLDHLCRNRSCVNPAHLEPVTMHENWRRGESVLAQMARATHCKRGHPFAGDNLVLRNNGRRACRACQRDRYMRSREHRP